jgi:hypothetical protein
VTSIEALERELAALEEKAGLIEDAGDGGA